MNAIFALMGLGSGEMIIILGASMIAVVFPILVVFALLIILKIVKSPGKGVSEFETGSANNRI